MGYRHTVGKDKGLGTGSGISKVSGILVSTVSGTGSAICTLYSNRYRCTGTGTGYKEQDIG